VDIRLAASALIQRLLIGRDGFRLGAAAVIILVFLCAWFSWPERADHVLLDAEFRLLRHYASRPIDKDVVVVGMDEAAFRALREPFALWHPHLGKFLQAMAVAKPSVLGLDVVLPDRSFQFMTPGYDKLLLQGLLALKLSQVPVVLGEGVDGEGTPHPIFPPYVALAGEKSLASVLVCTDSDGIVRLAGGISCNGQGVAETLSGAMAERLGQGSRQYGLIDYSVGDPWNYIPFMQVLEWFEQGEEAKLIELFGDLTDGGGTHGFSQDREQGLAHLAGRQTEQKG